MSEQPTRRLVGSAWVAARTGLHRNSVLRAAAQGRIPAATKLLDTWRFDPDAIEAWIAAGMPSNQRTTGTERVQAAPAARDGQRGRASIPAPESTPALVVIYPNAAHRGIHDRRSSQTAKRPNENGSLRAN